MQKLNLYIFASSSRLVFCFFSRLHFSPELYHVAPHLVSGFVLSITAPHGSKGIRIERKVGGEWLFGVRRLRLLLQVQS
jgi:hypothetical protein